jgi:hypothetical protein
LPAPPTSSSRPSSGADRTRASRRAALLFASLIVSTAPLFPAPALADPIDASAKHAVGIYVEGAKGDDVRAAIASAFSSSADVLDDKDVKRALGKAGVKFPLGAALGSATTRKQVLPKIGAAATELSADGITIGRVKPKKGGGEELELLFVPASASDADVDSTMDVDDDLGAGVKSALDGPLSAMHAKPKVDDSEPAPAKTNEPASALDDKSDRPRNTHGREILGVFAAFDLGGRFFDFSDGLSSNLRDYDVFGAPGIALAAEVYPMAGLDVPVVQGLGLVGDFRIALGLGSETKDGQAVDTSWNRFDVGLAFHQPLAKQHRIGDKAVVLGARGTFGRDAFALAATGKLGDEAPGVEYLFIRGGFDAIFPAGPLLLELHGGYLGALSAGSVYERMRGSSIGGVDLSGGLTVPIALGFEARLTGEYIRWFYDFDPRADDRYVAGGAVDQYVHLELGPAYVY